MNELIEKLVAQLGINTQQAEGGVGLVLGMLKKQLDGGDFSKIASLFGNVDELLEKAPSGTGGLGGLVGNLLGGKAGNIAKLTQGFSKLDIEAGKIPDFGNIIMDFVKDKGNEDLMSIVSKVLK